MLGIFLRGQFLVVPVGNQWINFEGDAGQGWKIW